MDPQRNNKQSPKPVPELTLGRDSLDNLNTLVNQIVGIQLMCQNLQTSEQDINSKTSSLISNINQLNLDFDTLAKQKANIMGKQAELIKATLALLSELTGLQDLDNSKLDCIKLQQILQIHQFSNVSELVIELQNIGLVKTPAIADKSGDSLDNSLSNNSFPVTEIVKTIDSSIQIELGGEQQLEQLYEIERQYSAFPITKEQFFASARKIPTQLLIAYHNGKIVGFMMYQLSLYKIELTRLVVGPEIQGQAVDEKLLRVLIDKLSSKKCNKILSKVRETDKLLIKTLQKFGFECTASKENEYPNSSDLAFSMRYVLGRANYSKESEKLSE